MAFLCNECHGKTGCQFPHMLRSRGRCESCGKTSDCVDCIMPVAKVPTTIRVLALHADPNPEEAKVYDALREAAQSRYYLSGYPGGQRESVYVASIGDVHYIVCGHDPVTCCWMHAVQGKLEDVLKYERLTEV